MMPNKTTPAKLYLLTQDTYTGYDTYSDCIVCANSEEEARTINPSGYDYDYDYQEWPMPDKVTVKLIGTATDDVELNSVVCASYHAG